MRIGDWSSDVGSSDLDTLGRGGERDGHENLSLGAKAVVRPAPDGELGLVGRYIRSDTEFDGYNAFLLRDQTDEASRIKTRALRGWATYGTGQDAPWTFTAHGTLVDLANRNRDGAPPLNSTTGQLDWSSWDQGAARKRSVRDVRL